MELLKVNISARDVRKCRGEVCRNKTKEKEVTMDMSCEQGVHALKKVCTRVESK